MKSYEVYVNEDLSFIIEGVKNVNQTDGTLVMTGPGLEVIAAFDISNVVMVRKI